MNELQVFVNNQFGEIRTTIIDDKPWFVGLDIAKALGYVKPRNAIAKHVEKDDALKWGGVDSFGRRSEMTVINESGLYSLIFGSKLPQAKQFKHWVTNEVLPQIRKTGGYIPLTPNDDEKTILSKALQISQRTLQEKEALINVIKPKAERYDRLISADGCFSFNVAAKSLGTGRNRLMAFLRNKGVLFRDGLSNIAYQQYCDNGYFKVRYSVGKNGVPCAVTKVTPKGIDYICRLIELENRPKSA